MGGIEPDFRKEENTNPRQSPLTGQSGEPRERRRQIKKFQRHLQFQHRFA